MTSGEPSPWWHPLGRGFPVYAVLAAAAYAWVQGGVLAYHVLGFTLCLIALTMLAGLAPIGAVDVRRMLPAHPLTQGDTLTVRLEVTLPWWWPWLYLGIHDALPEGLGSAPLAQFLVFPWFQRRLTLEYTIPSVPRGVYRFTAATVVSGDLFGFIVRRRAIADTQEVEVWPTRISLSLVHALPREWQGELRLAALQVSESSELRTIRDYLPGDRLSRIHWQTTARTGSFKVKQFEPLTIPALSVVVDQPGTFSPHQFELALQAAASLAEYSLERGQDVGLVLLGPDIVLEPDSGQTHRARLMRELAAAQWRPDAVQPVLSFAGFRNVAATIVITGRPPSGVRLRSTHASVVLYVGRRDTPSGVETLDDLPRVLAFGGRL
jgi:uncharacterized protein (DUF58 family)